MLADCFARFFSTALHCAHISLLPFCPTRLPPATGLNCLQRMQRLVMAWLKLMRSPSRATDDLLAASFAGLRASLSRCHARLACTRIALRRTIPVGVRLCSECMSSCCHHMLAEACKKALAHFFCSQFVFSCNRPIVGYQPVFFVHHCSNNTFVKRSMRQDEFQKAALCE